MRFNNQTLRLAWHKAVMILNTADADEAEPEEDEVCGHFSLFFLHTFDPRIKLYREVSTYKWRYLNVSYQKSVLNVLSLHFQSTRGSHYILYQGLSLCSFCVATFIKQWACLQGDTQNKKSFHFGSLLNHP